MKPFRQHLIGKYGRAHFDVKNIMYWVKLDFGYPEIQEWELLRHPEDTFIVQQVLQSKVIRSLCAKV